MNDIDKVFAHYGVEKTPEKAAKVREKLAEIKHLAPEFYHDFMNP